MTRDPEKTNSADAPAAVPAATHMAISPDSGADDLGLGRRVAEESGARFLNPDGSFNVRRHGRSFFQSLHLYHSLLTMSWPRLLGVVTASYLIANLLFAAGYLLCGPQALTGSTARGLGERLLESFFFSVQTLSTIGYGALSPNGLAANILVTAEAIVGLMIVAISTGIFFSRFARPRAKIIFSRDAVIAPYQGITAFEFRIANERKSQLTQVEATVVMSRLVMVDGKPSRGFHPLKLERRTIMFMPLHWVVVHPIDEESPLRGVTEEQFGDFDAEFLILLTAYDETFSQTVHARSSYKGAEVRWGAKFSNMYRPPEDGLVSVDLAKIHDTEPE